MTQPRKINLISPVFGIGGLTLLALGFVITDALLQSVPGAMTSPETAHLRLGVAIVNNWQSLLGALFTPLVAVLTVWMVLRQIQETGLQEDGKVHRRWRAQRALMPLVMSRVASPSSPASSNLPMPDMRRLAWSGGRFLGNIRADHRRRRTMVASFSISQCERRRVGVPRILHRVRLRPDVDRS